MTITKHDLPRLSRLLRSLAERIDKEGGSAWKHLNEWETAVRLGISLVGDEPGEAEDEDGNPRPYPTSLQTQQDRLENARAGRWFAEHVSILTNLEAPLRRAHRIYDLAAVEDRRQRNHDGTFDPILAAEAAAAGYCRSCWRLDQQLVEIETDKHGHRYYRDYCRDCGGYKHENGQEPPMDMLRIRQRRAWNTADLAKANARRGKAS